MEWEIFRRLFIFCLSFLVGVLFGAVVLLMVPFLICRLIISYLAAFFRPDLGGMLALRDNYFIGKNFWEYPRTTLLSKSVGKGRLRADYVKGQFVNEIFDKELNFRPKKGFSRLQQYPYSWMGYLFLKWEDNFNISDHVRDYTCEKLRDDPNYIFSDEELNEIEDEIYSKLFPKDKSMWDMTLVPKRALGSGEEETLMYFRMNHSMGDGYSILTILAELFGRETDKQQIETYQKLGMISWKLKFVILIKLIVFGLYDLTESLTKLTSPNVWKAVHPKKNEKLLYFESQLIPMETVKEISKIQNVSVTAVIYSAVANGVRKALMKNTGSVPSTMTTSIALPVCGRPTGITNHVIGDFISLPVGESDSVKRLKMIHKNICRAQTSTTRFMFFYLYTLLCAPFSRITQFLVDPRFSPSVVIITSIPGFKKNPGKEYEFKTSTFAGTLGMVNINSPLGFSLLSINERLQSVTVGHNAVFTIQDLEDITRCIEEEFEKLKNMQ